MFGAENHGLINEKPLFERKNHGLDTEKAMFEPKNQLFQSIEKAVCNKVLTPTIAENVRGIVEAFELFEVTDIDGVDIPEGLKILINFDDNGKIRCVGPSPFYVPNCSEEIDNIRFMGNLNVFVMRKRKELKRVHQSFNGDTFLKKNDTFSFKEILESL